MIAALAALMKALVVSMASPTSASMRSVSWIMPWTVVLLTPTRARVLATSMREATTMVWKRERRLARALEAVVEPLHLVREPARGADRRALALECSGPSPR